MIVPSPGYHQRSLQLCKKHDIIYISDETVTGFGRLGHWFSSKEVFYIQPDIITCAKGLTSGYLPMGAAIISDSLIDDIKSTAGSQPFTNGYTYSCHPVAAKAALTNIDIISRDKILEHVRDISPHFQNRFRNLGKKYDIIGDARGVGLLGCLEGVSSKSSS